MQIFSLIYNAYISCQFNKTMDIRKGNIANQRQRTFSKAGVFIFTRIANKVNKITVANFKDLQMSDRKIMCDIQLSKTFNECIEWLREAQVS